MKKTTIALAFFLSSNFFASAGESTTYRVSAADVSNGYIVKKIWLKDYVKPNISITGLSYTAVGTLPADALPSQPGNFDVVLGKERKKPFAFVRIPAYTSADGILNQISAFTLEVEEVPAESSKSAAKTTAVTNSVLATGSWYKISVGETGLHKIDYSFLSSKLGINSPVSSNNIRVYGNGGKMLPENNAVSRQDDLTENSIWINDGGDGTFGPGDYFVFYAMGPDSWQQNADKSGFNHTKNLYESKSYYFLNFDLGTGKRVETVSGGGAANVTVSEFNDRLLHEEELNNPGAMGKKWWGEDFGTAPGRVSNRTFEMDLKNATSSNFRVSLGSGASLNSSFNLTANGQPMGTYSVGAAATSADDQPVALTVADWQTASVNGKTNIKITYQPGTSNGLGYLDFIEVNTGRPLAFTEDQLNFRSLSGVGAGNIAAYNIADATGSTQVWDVTNPYDPQRMAGSLNGNTYSFTRSAETLHEFTAFRGNNISIPEFVAKVDNQNLHGSGPVDYIIVTHPDFVSQANDLASFHQQRRAMRTLVATTTQVYNEFSSGSQDISAIRDLARLFYDRAGSDVKQMPRYLLLLGDASYDYRNRVRNNTNYVPTFEAEESFSVISSYSNDDFFGFLDDNEYIENTQIPNTLDVGVGRLPVKTADEARAVVNKIKRYKSPSSLGAWRVNTTIIADNEDQAGPHLDDGEVMDSTIIKNSDLYNATKVYLNVIPTLSTPGGNRSPDANKAINDQIFKGTFLFNYSGHGNTQVLAEERILTQDDYSKWKNIDKLPIMVTATCDFSRFDHPDYVSAGENLVLKPDGGVITAVTTTQLVFQGPNRIINREFLDAQFQKVDGQWNTFGDAYRIGKNFMYSKAGTTADVIINFRKFALLGDPALEPNFPEYNVKTEGVMDGATKKPADSIKALGEYHVNGFVSDENGLLLPDFNGRINLTIYDKPKTVETVTYYGKKQFVMRNNIVYRGKATVTNGKFSVSFIAPKDINYDFGKGKFSYYAENGSTDGAGTDNTITIGGYSDNPVIENFAPIVKPFIGDSTFRSGGLTGSNTMLFVILEDETGINVSGNSIGHDLEAILDGDVSHPYVMNDYYETAPNTYKRGYVNFPISDIPEGRHRMTVKAWDVNNNSGEGYIDFEVVNGTIVQVQNLMNYPNPFSDVTHFVFEHNHPDETLDAEINIYTSGGSHVRTLTKRFTAGISRSNEITWDGTGDQGAKLPAGMYLYRMKIATPKGLSTTAYQKLVIIR